MNRPWIFMGVDRSHFSAKLRPALRYKQIHYVEYPPDWEEIQRRTGANFIPVVVDPGGEMHQDSTEIIDLLEERFDEPRLLPASPADLALCRLIELYADEFFLLVSMRTRWAYSENAAEMRRAFAAFSGSVQVGESLADRMSSYLPMLGITEATMPAIDSHTDDVLEALNRHLAKSPFLLGDRMSLADCALMGPLYAHLYQDRVTRKRLLDEAIEVCAWIERCNRPVPESMGTWFGGQYPGTLREVLSLVGRDAVPHVLAHEEALVGWVAGQQTGVPLPRVVGECKSELRGLRITCGARPYVTWKIERFRQAFDAIGSTSERGLLVALVGGALVSSPSKVPIAKSGNELVVVTS